MFIFIAKNVQNKVELSFTSDIVQQLRDFNIIDGDSCFTSCAMKPYNSYGRHCVVPICVNKRTLQYVHFKMFPERPVNFVFLEISN